MTKRIGMISAVVFFSFLWLGPARAGEDTGDPAKSSGQVENRKLVCMLQDSMQSHEGIEHEYQGKKYYLCCEGCVKGFDKDPTRYSHATDPVNGKSVDKSDARIYAYNGHAYFFSSAETLAAFAQAPEKYLGAHAPREPAAAP